MAYYARRIGYMASEVSFVALVEIVRRKGGEPIKFVLYKFNGGAHRFNENEYEKIEFGSKERKSAIEFFPYGPIVYEEKSCFEELNKDLNLPRRRKNLWQKTTDWLYKAAVGGAYQVYPQGTWVKIGSENRCKKHREKRGKRLKFGNLGHILLVTKKELESLIKEKENEFFDIMKYEARREIEEKIEIYQSKIVCLVEEMRYAKAKKMGMPLVKHIAICKKIKNFHNIIRRSLIARRVFLFDISEE